MSSVSSRATLEVFRRQLEEGAVTIAHASGTTTFPARFTLVAPQRSCTADSYVPVVIAGRSTVR